MATTARNLITQALRDLGAIGARNVPTAADLQDGFEALNQWVTDLDTQRATIFTVKREVFPLVSGTSSYTIGPGGTWNTVRPMRIDHVGLVLNRTAATVVEVSLGKPVTDQEYQRVVAKALPATYPSGAYYDHGFEATGLARIWPLPIPTSTVSDLVLYLPRAMQEFASLSTLYAFPPGYERAIRANLAIELAPLWTREPSGALVQRAVQSLVAIKRANRRTRTLSIDPMLVGRSAPYNVWTDV